MTSLLGTFGLTVVVVASAFAAVLWGRAAAERDQGPARLATALALAGALGAVAAMEVALLRNDVALRFVADHSSAATPVAYRVSALWGGLQGSLLLWVLVLAGFALLVARRPADPRLHTLQPRAAAVVSVVVASFGALTMLGSRPFARYVPAPADGVGPNPLLVDHPAMLVHPPLLYLGYAGLVVPFGYAIAALLAGDAGRAWVVATRTWSLVAWVALTGGVLLGAWWSYTVLGWGGYWAWDPVENAALLPWLTTTALLHVSMAGRHRAGLAPWCVGLAGTSFLLVVTGTFLTRSGVVESVHSFSPSPLGAVLLGLLGAGIAALGGLVVWRADVLRPAPDGAGDGTGASLTRATLLVAAALVLVGSAAVLLLATVAPVLLRALGAGEVSVGRPFYDRLAGPVALSLLLLMAVGPLARWRGEQGRRLARRLAVPAAAGALVVCLLGLVGPGVVVLLTGGLAAAVLAVSGRAVVARRSAPLGRRGVGGHLAHAGFALLAVGVATSTGWAATTEATVTDGGMVRTGAQAVRLDGFERHADARRMTTSVRLSVVDGDGARTVEPAGLAYYPDRDVTVAVPSVSSGAGGDLYVTLLAVDPDAGTATLRVGRHPLVWLLWAGGALVALGGVLAAVPERPRRGRTGEEAQPAPAAVPDDDTEVLTS